MSFQSSYLDQIYAIMLLDHNLNMHVERHVPKLHCFVKFLHKFAYIFKAYLFVLFE